MTEKKIYLSVDGWLQDKKDSINQVLNEAQTNTDNPEIIELMQELLKGLKINTRITDYFEISKDDKS